MNRAGTRILYGSLAAHQTVIQHRRPGSDFFTLWNGAQERDIPPTPTKNNSARHKIDPANQEQNRS